MEHVAQVFLAKWELFGEKSFRKRFLGFLFRMVGRTVTLSPTSQSPRMATLFSAVSWRKNYSKNLFKVPASDSWVKDRQLRCAITGMPFLSSSGPSMPHRTVRSQFLSSMMGKGNFPMGPSQL